MGYKIAVDSDRNIGLQPWFMALTGNPVDVQLHGEREVITGSIVRVSSPLDPNPEVTLVTVDLCGRPVAGGDLRTILIERVAQVAVW